MKNQLEALFARQRALFPALGERETSVLVRLNNGAGSEMPGSAIAAMTAHMRTSFSNEGTIFPRLAQSRELKDAARSATADLLGCSPAEVGFGANTTTNLFMLSRALSRAWRKGDRVFVCETCHEANIAPWLALRHEGLVVEIVPMRDDTHLDYDWLEARLDERTRLIAVAASSNGTGTLHDIPRLVAAARTTSTLVALDAAHFAPHRALDVVALGVDLCFFSAYKCFGPHLGVFFVRRGLCESLAPVGIDPPEPERSTAARYETGTKSFESLAGWLSAISYLEQLGRAASELYQLRCHDRRELLGCAMRAIADWESELTAFGDRRLAELPQLTLYRQPGDGAQRLGVFSLNVAGRETVEVARELWQRARIEATHGHHGSLRTMARLAASHGGVSVRLSIAHYNSFEDLDAAADTLQDIVSALRSG